jgi:hypothetical protein
MFNSRFVEYFSTLRLDTAGKKRLYLDIDHLLDSVSKMPGMKETVLSLMVLRDFYRSQFGLPPT